MSRTGYKWNINEILSLQREYELLELSIEDIALRHKRSVSAIIFKLEAESILSEKNILSYPKQKKSNKMNLRSSKH
jgi:hypothetical protein